MADAVLDDPEFIPRRERFWTAALTDPRYSSNRIAVAERDGSLIGVAMAGPVIEPDVQWSAQLYDVVEWVTQQDVDLARRITEIAADHKVDADPASVSAIELGLDTSHSAIIAPVWAALLTGKAEAQGHGSPSDEIRHPTGRVPNLWFGDADQLETPRQRFHVEVYVAPEVVEQRLAAVVAAGGIVVDDSNTPSLTVIADQDGNTGVLSVA